MQSQSPTQLTEFDTKIRQYKSFKESSPFAQHCEHYTLMQAIESIQDISNKRVLDAGCGWGCYTELLAAKSPKSLTAIDISSEAVQLAKHWCSGVQNNNSSDDFLQFRVQDCADLEEADEYDVILANFLLPFAHTKHHLQLVCDRLFRAVKPGGVVMGFIPNGDVNVDVGRRAVGKQVNGMYAIPPTVRDGDKIELVLFTEPHETRIGLHWYKHRTYSNCFRTAGFDDVAGFVQFCKPIVAPSAVACFGRHFWRSVVVPPTAWLFRAGKFVCAR